MSYSLFSAVDSATDLETDKKDQINKLEVAETDEKDQTNQMEVAETAPDFPKTPITSDKLAKVRSSLVMLQEKSRTGKDDMRPKRRSWNWRPGPGENQ